MAIYKYNLNLKHCIFFLTVTEKKYKITTIRIKKINIQNNDICKN